MTRINDSLAEKEAQVAATLQADVATGTTPNQDPAEADAVEDLMNADPGFVQQVATAIDTGQEAWLKNHPGQPNPGLDPYDSRQPAGSVSSFDPLAALETMIAAESAEEDED